MGIVHGSITLATPNAGNYTVSMPENELDVIGFAPIGYVNGAPTYGASIVVGIYIDASNLAFFPLPANENYTTRKLTPIHVHVKGNALNLYVPYGGSGITIFYGIPDGTEIEYSLLKGITTSYENTSTTADASGTLSLTFPSGNVKITGIFVVGINGAVGQISMITGLGRTLSIPFSASPDPMDLPDNIYPLDLSSATSLSVNYNINYNSTGNATLVMIVYYQ